MINILIGVIIAFLFWRHMTKLSIIMPAYIDTYDKLDWMQEALQSVQSQSFTDWEVIIIDDKSTIALDVLKNEFKYPKFRWFKTAERSGPATCRNTAVELAQSEAILPLDADDMLANDNVLNVMFTEWSNNKSKFYYGNLRRLKKVDGEFQRDDKTFRLAEYTFKDSLNKNGLMPVSCIFSYDCWQKAGGWNNELEAGREDVEFWIKFGKVGCCGQKLNEETLIYRQHETSRDYALRRVNRRESEMINKIRLMHSDVYEGKYPMGCCGGGRGYIPPQNENGRIISAPSTLADYPESEKVWVEYAGNRQGGFGVNGPFTSYTYRVKGPGHKLQVHTNDLSRFRQAGRGQDFMVGVSPPDDYEQPGEKQPEEYIASEPVLAMIEQLDDIAVAKNG